MFLIQPALAQKKTTTSTPPNSTSANDGAVVVNIWIISNVTMLLIVIGVLIYTHLQVQQLKKALKFEEFKNNDLKKKQQLALITIKKMETNPDLVHSREFNLDYLRLRMDEDMFHSLIVNRLKIKISQLITVALRPDAAQENVIGIAGTGRKINEIFDVTYEIQNREGEWKTRVLFRVQIKLTKLPTQSTSSTITQILTCIENYLSPDQAPDNWQAVIQGRLVNIDWDQEAKPTPLLVLEQTEEGVNTGSKTQIYSQKHR